ncbi:hypothetical protein BHM03_00044691 [Ensete ventricosum]|nr:hypothetical protein BHM03_00044691 [Ensete ventricosum]
MSRVVDCAQYESLRQAGKGRRHGEPAQGHFPVYVGEEMERFEVRTELLGRPAFVQLLRLSAHEYGYEQRGVLRIPCPVPLFRRLLAAAASSSSSSSEEEEKEKEKELLRSFPELLFAVQYLSLQLGVKGTFDLFAPCLLSITTSHPSGFDGAIISCDGFCHGRLPPSASLFDAARLQLLLPGEGDGAAGRALPRRLAAELGRPMLCSAVFSTCEFMFVF